MLKYGQYYPDKFSNINEITPWILTNSIIPYSSIILRYGKSHKYKSRELCNLINEYKLNYLKNIKKVCPYLHKNLYKIIISEYYECIKSD